MCVIIINCLRPHPLTTHYLLGSEIYFRIKLGSQNDTRTSVGSGRVGSGRVGSVRGGEGRGGPVRAGSGWVGSGRGGVGRGGAGRSGPGWVGSSGVVHQIVNMFSHQ